MTGDIGLRGVGAGKGDAPRTKLDQNYRQKYDSIDFGHLAHCPVELDPLFKKVAPGRYRRGFK